MFIADRYVCEVYLFDKSETTHLTKSHIRIGLLAIAKDVAKNV